MKITVLGPTINQDVLVTDTVSWTIAPLDGYSYCYPRTYAINPAVASMVSIDAQGVISASTTDVTKIGDHLVEVTVSAYTDSITLQYTLTVGPCVVTGMSLNTAIADHSYTVGDDGQTWSYDQTFAT